MSEPQQLRHEERTVTVHGTAGQRIVVTHRVYCHFNINQITPTDSHHDGLMTKVHFMYIGVDRAHLEPALSKQLQCAPGEFHASCQPLIDISFNVEFLGECDWSCLMSGIALKRPGDTRETLRDRAVDDFEKQQPEHVRENARFREQVAKMRTYL